MKPSIWMEYLTQLLSTRRGVSRNEMREEEFNPKYFRERCLGYEGKTIIQIEEEFLDLYKSSFYNFKEAGSKITIKHIYDMVCIMEEFIAEISRSPSSHLYLGLHDEDTELWVAQEIRKKFGNRLETLQKKTDIGRFIKIFELYVAKNNSGDVSSQKIMREFVNTSFPDWYKNEKGEYLSNTYLNASYQWFEKNYYVPSMSSKTQIQIHVKSLLEIVSYNDPENFQSGYACTNVLFEDFFKEIHIAEQNMFRKKCSEL